MNARVGTTVVAAAAAVLAVLTAGCNRQTTQQAALPPQQAAAQQTFSADEYQPQELKRYHYPGMSYRDPFIPLSGEKLARARLGLTKEAVVPGLGMLSLKGIIKDSKDEIALFSSPQGSYLLVNGSMYDNQNRKVPGMTGRIVLSRREVVLTLGGDSKTYALPEQYQ